MRTRWYGAAVVAAVAGGALTVLVHRTTGNGYPFIAGFVMLFVLLGGMGPSLVAGFGTLTIALLSPTVGTIYGTDGAEVVRFLANVILLAAAAALSGLWRDSRAASASRAVELRDASARLQEILDGASDAIVLTDSNFQVTFANAQLSRLLGEPLTQIVGRRLHELRDLAGVSGGSEPTPESLKDGDSMLVEREMTLANGDRIQVEASVRVLSGRRILASVRDISERKRDQERQQAERNLLDGILATSVAGVLVLDLEGLIIFANQRAEDVLELVRSADPGRRYDEPVWHRVAIDGGPWPLDQRPYAQVQATGKPVFDVRHAIDFPDGRRLALSVNAAPLLGEDGAMRAIVVGITDITLALEAERALRERDAQLERITTAMPGMVYQYLLDSQGNARFLYVSKFAEELLNVSAAALYADSKYAFKRIHPDDRADLSRSIIASAASLQPWTYEFRLQDPLRPDVWRWISARALPERSEALDAVVWVGIMVDATERKQLETELRQAQKMESVGRLAGGIAHDFNNLLTAILGHAELLALDVPDDPEVRESVAQIRVAAESGSALTRQLLGFARKQVVAPQVVDVNSVVRHLPPLLRRVLSDGVELRTDLHPSAGLVRVDPAQLDQVLMNLAVNAMDAMPTGGILQLATRRIEPDSRDPHYASFSPGALVEIEVRDTGVGMSEQVQAQAFEPFFTTKAPGKGTGLGLATSYGIIVQAGGTLSLESTVGRGTLARIVLPATDGPVTPAPLPDAVVPTSEAGTETILVVDDDAGVRRVTAESLRRCGYAVIEADGGPSAIDASRAQDGTIDLLVTDVVMPQMSGRLLADALLRERPTLRVLFVSGYADGALAQHGIVDSGVALLEKPFDRAALARRVRAILDDTRDGATL